MKTSSKGCANAGSSPAGFETSQSPSFQATLNREIAGRAGVTRPAEANRYSAAVRYIVNCSAGQKADTENERPEKETVK